VKKKKDQVEERKETNIWIHIYLCRSVKPVVQKSKILQRKNWFQKSKKPRAPYPNPDTAEATRTTDQKNDLPTE